VLKPPGKGFARVAVASTLCPACSQRVEHRANFTIIAETTETPAGARTRLVANQTIVIHACTTETHAP
jgi:hypothetical protein